MSASQLTSMSYIAMGIAIAMFALAVVFFFWFDIINIINELSGRKVRQNVKKTYIANEKSGVKQHQVGPENLKRGKLTEAMTKPSTIKLGENGRSTTVPLGAGGQAPTSTLPQGAHADQREIVTAPISVGGETTDILSETASGPAEAGTTDILGAQQPAGDETTELSGDETAYQPTGDETTELSDAGSEENAPGETTELSHTDAGAAPVRLTMLGRVMIIHTDEVIQ